MRNHLGSYECKLCLTLHTNEGSYLVHTQAKKHQDNLWVLPPSRRPDCRFCFFLSLFSCPFLFFPRLSLVLPHFFLFFYLFSFPFLKETTGIERSTRSRSTASTIAKSGGQEKVCKDWIPRIQSDKATWSCHAPKQLAVSNWLSRDCRRRNTKAQVHVCIWTKTRGSWPRVSVCALCGRAVCNDWVQDFVQRDWYDERKDLDFFQQRAKKVLFAVSFQSRQDSREHAATPTRGVHASHECYEPLPRRAAAKGAATVLNALIAQRQHNTRHKLYKKNIKSGCFCFFITFCLDRLKYCVFSGTYYYTIAYTSANRTARLRT